jgi:hypothetical protein
MLGLSRRTRKLPLALAALVSSRLLRGTMGIGLRCSAANLRRPRTRGLIWRDFGDGRPSSRRSTGTHRAGAARPLLSERRQRRAER